MTQDVLPMTPTDMILAQFASDLRDQILSALAHDPSNRSALTGMATRELLVRHLNWLSRYIPPKPRRVHVSSVLAGKRPLPDADHDDALSEIASLLVMGADVTAHLSRGISVGVDLRPVKSKAHRRDLDLMLSDWGVHHRHLSRVPEADGFVARTGPILFAAFQPNDVFLIDIVEHGHANPNAWTTINILRTMAREWPNAGLILEMKGALPGGQSWTDADRLILRANGYAASIDIDGKVFMPRLGLTSAGTSTIVSMRVIRMMKHLRLIAEDVARGTGDFWDALRTTNIRLDTEPDFRARVYVDGCGLADEKTQTFIWMGRW